MRLLTVITAVFLLLIPASEITARPIIVEGDFKFVGFSDAKVRGWDFGGINILAAFQNACTAKFGENARWATSKEMMEASYIPTEPVDESAWVRPIVVATTLIDGDVHNTDYSGFIYRSLSCTTFAGLGIGHGLIYAIDLGQFLVLECDTELHVACSAQQ